MKSRGAMSKRNILVAHYGEWDAGKMSRPRFPNVLGSLFIVMIQRPPLGWSSWSVIWTKPTSWTNPEELAVATNTSKSFSITQPPEHCILPTTKLLERTECQRRFTTRALPPPARGCIGLSAKFARAIPYQLTGVRLSFSLFFEKGASEYALLIARRRQEGFWCPPQTIPFREAQRTRPNQSALKPCLIKCIFCVSH